MKNHNLDLWRTRFSVLGIAAASMVGMSVMGGDPIRWIADSGGDFDNGANWEGGVVPGTTDFSIFDLSSVYNVFFNQDQVVDRSAFRSGSVTLDMGGYNFDCSNRTGWPDLVVGEQAGADATVTVTHGNLLFRIEGQIGYYEGTTGHLILTGSDAVLGPSEGWVNSLRIGSGVGATGRLDVLAGATATVRDLIVGINSGHGEVLVDGIGSQVNVNDDTWVGNGDGTGTLTVQNGGFLNIEIDSALMSGGDGNILVTGAGSQISMGGIALGENGSSTMTLSDGALLTTTGKAYLGTFGGFGEYIVTGPGTTVDGNGVQVGDGNTESTGRLEISDGAFYDANGDWFRVYFPGSSMTVTGAGTQVIGNSLSTSIGTAFTAGGGASIVLNNNIHIDDMSALITDADTYMEGSSFDVTAYDASTSALIQNGAMVMTHGNQEHTFGNAVVQDASGGLQSAVLTVDGIDSVLDVWNTMFVGRDDLPGTLNITNGGSVVAYDAQVGSNGVLNGEITVRGGGLDPAMPTPGLVAKTFQVATGATLSDTDIVVQKGGTLTGDSILSANVQNKGGRVAPGVSGNALTIDGTYAQSAAASMRIRLSDWYHWDELEVLDTTNLSGQLFVQVQKEGTWDPPFGRSYTFITGPSINGQFDFVASNSREVDFDLTYSPTSVEFTVIQPLKLQVDNLVGGKKATFTVSQGTPGAVTAVVYGLQKGQQEINSGGWCVLFGFSVPPQEAMNRVVVSGVFNQNGVYQSQRMIPGSASGLDIYLQAAEKGTCPARIMSNVIQQVIG